MQIAIATRPAGVSGFAFTVGNAIRRSRSDEFCFSLQKAVFASLRPALAGDILQVEHRGRRRYSAAGLNQYPFNHSRNWFFFCQSPPASSPSRVKYGLSPFLGFRRHTPGCGQNLRGLHRLPVEAAGLCPAFGGRPQTRAIVARRSKLIGSSDPWLRSGLAEKAAH